MTATSTMEAEFISCFEATSHGVWLKSFISGLRVMDSISRPLSIYCDNSAAALSLLDGTTIYSYALTKAVRFLHKAPWNPAFGRKISGWDQMPSLYLSFLPDFSFEKKTGN